MDPRQNLVTCSKFLSTKQHILPISRHRWPSRHSFPFPQHRRQECSSGSVLDSPDPLLTPPLPLLRVWEANYHMPMYPADFPFRRMGSDWQDHLSTGTFMSTRLPLQVPTKRSTPFHVGLQIRRFPFQISHVIEYRHTPKAIPDCIPIF